MSKSKTIWATIMGILSSILAFLGLVGCCGLPIFAGILAALGIGASRLSFLAAYKWWFIGFAILSLLFGFHQVYGKKRNDCCGSTNNESCCSTTPTKINKANSQAFQKIFLWIGAIVTMIILIIGFQENSATNSANERCCPIEKTTLNSGGCCPATKPEQEKKATSCCPQ